MFKMLRRTKYYQGTSYVERSYNSLMEPLMKITKIWFFVCSDAYFHICPETKKLLPSMSELHPAIMDNIWYIRYNKIWWTFSHCYNSKSYQLQADSNYCRPVKNSKRNDKTVPWAKSGGKHCRNKLFNFFFVLDIFWRV